MIALKTLDQVLSLFSKEQPELSVVEAAARLRRPRSTVYRIFSQIENEGFLERDEDTGRYRLGIRLAVLGEIALHSTSLQRVTLPWMRRLSQVTGETATLLIEVDGQGIAVQHVESIQRVVVKAEIGRTWPLHASAGGKVLLAWLPVQEQRSMLKGRLSRFSDATITAMPALLREFQITRQRGYAVVRGEYFDGIWGAAAPVFNHHERVEAAVTVGGPHPRISRESFPALGKAAIDAAEGISRQMGYSGPYPRKELVRAKDYLDQVERNRRPGTRSKTSGRRSR